MPATGGDHPRQHLAPVVRQLLAAVAAVAMLAASSCRLNSDGIGDQGDAARTDAGDAGAPPNVDRVDGGDGALRTDVAGPPDAAVADAPLPDGPGPVMPDATAPPPPPPACEGSERRCAGNTPEICTAGAWVPGAACPTACAAGACIDCVPGSKRCADRTSQVCSATGAWMTESQCPFLCTGAGACTGVCAPRSVVCMGSTRRTCRADASGYEEMDCPAPPGGAATCRDATCGFDCPDPMRRFKCGNACCQCQRAEDCPANNVCTAGACKYQAPTIHITGGFYGRNCQGMNRPALPPDARPDRTTHLAQACEGKTVCTYDVNHLVIGDPAVGCGKVYEATWQCLSGATRTTHMATVKAEASFEPPLRIACAP